MLVDTGEGIIDIVNLLDTEFPLEWPTCRWLINISLLKHFPRFLLNVDLRNVFIKGNRVLPRAIITQILHMSRHKQSGRVTNHARQLLAYNQRGIVQIRLLLRGGEGDAPDELDLGLWSVTGLGRFGHEGGLGLWHQALELENLYLQQLILVEEMLVLELEVWVDCAHNMKI